MHNPELQRNPVSALPEEILLEALSVAANAGYPQFIHERSDPGHMFDTGNHGGPEKYFANDVYRTPIPFDFTDFDNYSGDSIIKASLFSIDDRCLVSFFNIERDNGEKLTYGLMMGYSSNSDIAELIHGPEDGDFGRPAGQETSFRQPVFSWLESFSA